MLKTGNGFHNSTKAFLIDSLLQPVRKDLVAILLAGSIDAADFTKNWSDLDLIIVVKEINAKTLALVAEGLDCASRKIKLPIGAYTISAQEFFKPADATHSLDGKTLQALLELSVRPDRMLYLASKNKPYVPDAKMVQEYSRANILMLRLRYRRLLIEVHSQTMLRDAANKGAHYVFICSKLYIQLASGKTITDKKKLISEMQKAGHKKIVRILLRNVALQKQRRIGGTELKKITSSNLALIEEIATLALA